jgi:hypothetical protein
MMENLQKILASLHAILCFTSWKVSLNSRGNEKLLEVRGDLRRVINKLQVIIDQNSGEAKE